MNLPERFDLTYVDANNEKVRPVMLHRVIFGSIERFIGILIEHFAGAFPLWLAPRQVAVLPVNNEYHLEYAKKVVEALANEGVRVELDAREEKLGYRYRDNQLNKLNYQVVIGDAERDSNTVKVRKFGSQEQISYPLDEFVSLIKLTLEQGGNAKEGFLKLPEGLMISCRKVSGTMIEKEKGVKEFERASKKIMESLSQEN